MTQYCMRLIFPIGIFCFLVVGCKGVDSSTDGSIEPAGESDVLIDLAIGEPDGLRLLGTTRSKLPRAHGAIGLGLRYELKDGQDNVVAFGQASDPRRILTDWFEQERVAGGIQRQSAGMLTLRLPNLPGTLKVWEETREGLRLLGQVQVGQGPEPLPFPPSFGTHSSALLDLAADIIRPPVLVSGTGDPGLLDIVVVSEGYTEEDLNLEEPSSGFRQFYRDDVDRLILGELQNGDFSCYLDRINLWRVDVRSRDSGVGLASRTVAFEGRLEAGEEKTLSDGISSAQIRLVSPIQCPTQEKSFLIQIDGQESGVTAGSFLNSSAGFEIEVLATDCSGERGSVDLIARAPLKTNRSTAFDMYVDSLGLQIRFGSGEGWQSAEKIARTRHGEVLVVLCNSLALAGWATLPSSWNPVRTIVVSNSFLTNFNMFFQRSPLSHQLGHAVLGLLDEYSSPVPGLDTACRAGLTSANLSASPERDQLPWKDLVLRDTPLPTDWIHGLTHWGVVGAFEGGAGCSRGYWHAQQSCLMNNGFGPMCAVCQRELVRFFATLNCADKVRGDGRCDECLGDDPDCACPETLRADGKSCDACLGDDPDCACPPELLHDGECQPCLGDDFDCECPASIGRYGKCHDCLGDDADCECDPKWRRDGICDTCLGDDPDCSCPAELSRGGMCLWTAGDQVKCDGAVFEDVLPVGYARNITSDTMSVAITLVDTGSTANGPAAMLLIDGKRSTVSQGGVVPSDSGLLVKVGQVESAGDAFRRRARICILPPPSAACPGALLEAALRAGDTCSVPEAKLSVSLVGISSGSAAILKIDGDDHIFRAGDSLSVSGVLITIVEVWAAGDDSQRWARICITEKPESCVPESDQGFCQRLGKDCETILGIDNCGQSRSADCGVCMDPESCGGGGNANVCAIPGSACDGALKDRIMVVGNIETAVADDSTVSYSVLDFDLTAPLVLLRVKVDKQFSYFTILSQGQSENTTNGFVVTADWVDFLNRTAHICTRHP